MVCFRYQAIGADATEVSGVIEAEDRRTALRELTLRGLFPARLEAAAPAAAPGAPPTPDRAASGERAVATGRVARREITAFTREMASLLEATIPIPRALESLAEQAEHAGLRRVVADIASRVRRGQSLSDSMALYPRLFGPLYTSMIRVGEESGRLAAVMADLADLLERADEMRGEVLSAVAYPAFVLALGILTTFILLVFVMPSLFRMLQGISEVLPLPTRVLLGTSAFLKASWLWLLLAAAAVGMGLRAWLKRPAGARAWDALKLRLPVVGSVFRAAALGRFARTLGTLEVSGVSLLPALEIVRHTVGNRFVAARIADVAEETRGGDSLAEPLRKLGFFPATMVQMIAVGEETGRLGAMLERVADIQERVVRSRSRTLISLLAPVLILAVGAVVGFIVISLLLPIFRMSQGMQ
ncbi:MAG: type II secretion system F family protein [Planctomycetes bacterium]|nr:type II secretion system F family protein [Planctomycetota bacterium]